MCQTWATGMTELQGPGWGQAAVSLVPSESVPNQQVSKQPTGSRRIIAAARSPVSAACRLAALPSTMCRGFLPSLVLRLGSESLDPSCLVPDDTRPVCQLSTCLGVSLLAPTPRLCHRIHADLHLQDKMEACSPPVQVRWSRRSVRAHVWPCDYLQGDCVKRSVGREINTTKK
jgi:hypothetical protein